MESSEENRFAIFNEVCVTLYLYGMITLTDFNLSTDDNLMADLGFALLSVVFLSVFVSLAKVFVVVYREYRDKILRRCSGSTKKKAVD